MGTAAQRNTPRVDTIYEFTIDILKDEDYTVINTRESNCQMNWGSAKRYGIIDSLLV